VRTCRTRQINSVTKYRTGTTATWAYTGGFVKLRELLAQTTLAKFRAATDFFMPEDKLRETPIEESLDRGLVIVQTVAHSKEPVPVGELNDLLRPAAT
jgi:hypothetical protein